MGELSEPEEDEVETEVETETETEKTEATVEETTEGESEESVGESSTSAGEESGTETETAETTVSESDFVGESEETTVEAVLSEPEKVEVDVKDKLYGEEPKNFYVIYYASDADYSTGTLSEQHIPASATPDQLDYLTGDFFDSLRNLSPVQPWGFYKIGDGSTEFDIDDAKGAYDGTKTSSDFSYNRGELAEEGYKTWNDAGAANDIYYGVLYEVRPYMYWINGYDEEDVPTIYYYATEESGGTPVIIGTDGVEYNGLDSLVKQSIKKAVFVNDIVATDVRSYFAGFSGLESITDLGKLNTTSATSFKSMFDDCSAITTLDVSGLETDNLADTSNMFDDCRNVTTITFGDNFDTSKVTNMKEMFSCCNKLTTINFGSKFDTSNVTDMTNMFVASAALEELDLTKFDTSNVTNMSAMFAQCGNLKTINVSDNFKVNQVTDSEYMFYDCTNLVGEQGTKYTDTTTPWDKTYAHIDEGTSNPGLFSGAPKFTWYWYLDGNTIHYTTTDGTGRTKITYSAATSMLPAMVQYDGLDDEDRKKNITKAVFDDAIQVENLAGLFYNFRVLKNIEGIEKLDTSTTTTMEYMFSDCYKLEYVDLTNFDTSNVTTMSHMFYYCSALEQLNLISFDTQKVTITNRMFNGCVNLETIIASDDFVVDQVTDSENMFWSCSKVIGGHGATLGFVEEDKTYARIGVPRKNPGEDEIEGFFSADPTPIPDMYWYLDETDPDNVVMHFTNVDTGHTQVYYLAWDYYYYDYLMRDTRENKIKKVVFDNSVKALETIHSMFLDFKSLTSITDLKNLDTSDVKQMYKMFENCESIETIDFQSLNTSKLQSMAYQFRNCKSLKSMDFSKSNTSELQTMVNVFGNCENLTSITFGDNFDTSNVQRFDTVFSSCTSLTTLDLTMFDTKNAKYAVGMFEYCTSLKTIKVSDKFDFTNVIGEDMFYNCTSLVGGNGTVYDSTKTDQEYARIDTDATPGYFTGGSAPTPGKKVSSFVVKTKPSKTTYNSGESFNPAGLVITVTYDDSTKADVDYASHKSDFSFSPTKITLSGNVTIRYGGKTATVAVTVYNPTPTPSEGGGSSSDSSSSDPTHGPMGDLTKNPAYANLVNTTTNNIPQNKLVSNEALANTLKAYPENANAQYMNARDDSGNVGYGQWLRVPNTTTWYFLSGSFNQGTGVTNTGFIANGWFNLGWDGQDKWYYFDSNGVMKIGWHQEGNKIYYLQADFSDNWYGKLMTGQQMIGGQVYNFDSNGALIN